MLVKDSKVECSKPASKPRNTADSPLAHWADELQGKEPVICLGIQDNHHRFCRGRTHTQRVALEKSLKTRRCCDTPGPGEKGLQQFQAEISCTGIICYYSSLVPSSRDTAGWRASLLSEALVVSVSSTLSTCLDTQGSWDSLFAYLVLQCRVRLLCTPAKP